MLCRKPYSQGVSEYGCGQCMPCRINRSRLWVGRMLLESYEHPASSFVTLTYNEENKPDGLVKKHLQGFLKRLRQEVAPRKFRYYAVGEYGEESGRPHYHAILFGIYPSEEKAIERCWKMGFIMLGTFSSASGSYVAGYVVKGLTKSGHPSLLGREPEFALMSRKPGLGIGVVKRIIKAYGTRSGIAAADVQHWFGERYQAEGKKYPLGRYLKSKVIEGLGILPDNVEARNLQRDFEIWLDKSQRDTYTNIKNREARQLVEAGRINVMLSKRRKI